MSNPLARRPRLRHELFAQSATALRLRERACTRRCTARSRSPGSPRLTIRRCEAGQNWKSSGRNSSPILTGEGPLRKDGEPRRLLAEYRLLKMAQLSYENLNAAAGPDHDLRLAVL